MSCCMKRRKEQVERIIERRNFEGKTTKFLIELKNISFSSIDKDILFEYHRKCHKVYKKAMSFKQPNTKFVNQVVMTHERLMKELLKRGVRHDTYLEKI